MMHTAVPCKRSTVGKSSNVHMYVAWSAISAKKRANIIKQMFKMYLCSNDAGMAVVASAKPLARSSDTRHDFFRPRRVHTKKPANLLGISAVQVSAKAW